MKLDVKTYKTSEAKRKSSQKWHKTHREYMRKYQKKWIEENKEHYLEKHRIYKRKWYINNIEKALFGGAKKRAKEKNIKFNIKVKDIVIPKICPIFKVPLQIKHPKWAPSLDRIDNTKGYIKGNVMVISRYANILKRDATLNDLKKLVKFLNKFNIK